jgi:small-conductance mechanosensitive channel
VVKPMRADNSRHLIAAARRRTERTRRQALRALRRLDATGTPITFEAVAREAGVSRSWLYTQDDLRAEIGRLRERHRPPSPTPRTPDHQRASTASLLRRLEVATERVQRLEQTNRELREALAQALGTTRTARVLGDATRSDTPERRAAKLIGPC